MTFLDILTFKFKLLNQKFNIYNILKIEKQSRGITFFFPDAIANLYLKLLYIFKY